MMRNYKVDIMRTQIHTTQGVKIISSKGECKGGVNGIFIIFRVCGSTYSFKL